MEKRLYFCANSSLESKSNANLGQTQRNQIEKLLDRLVSGMNGKPKDTRPLTVISQQKIQRTLFPAERSIESEANLEIGAQ